MKTLLLMVMMLTGWAMSCRAQLTLEACQQMAKQNYPLIKRYDLIRRSAAYNVSNIKKAWLPQVQASVQATVQNRTTQLPDKPSSILAQSGQTYEGIGKEQYRLQVEISQTLWDGGRISRQAEVEKRKTEIEEAQTDVNLYALRRRVSDLFFSQLLLDERIRLNAQLQAMLQSNEDKLRAMLQRGVAMQSDVDRLRAERLRAIQAGDELTAARHAVSRMLALFCGVEQADSLVKPSSEIDTNPKTNERPELQLIDCRLRLADAQQQFLKSRLLPVLSIFAQGYYGRPGYNLFEDMQRRRLSFNALAGARLSWSLSSLYTRRNDLHQLGVQREEAENARELFLLNNQMEEAQQQAHIAGRRKVMQADDEIVSLRQSIRRATEAQLTHGTIDADRLLQEITKENEACITRAVHELELLQSIYELKIIKGAF